MLQSMQMSGETYLVARRDNEQQFKQALMAKRNGHRVLFASCCVECGDLLFGEAPILSTEELKSLSCEEGHHHTRPGVFV